MKFYTNRMYIFYHKIIYDMCKIPRLTYMNIYKL